MSLALSQPMISPLERAKPLFSESYTPLSDSLLHPLSCDSYFRIISTVPSVEPPSMTKYSKLGYPWLRMERIVASRYFSPLYTDVTREIRGHADPFAVARSSLPISSACCKVPLAILTQGYIDSTQTLDVSKAKIPCPSARRRGHRVGPSNRTCPRSGNRVVPRIGRVRKSAGHPGRA